MSEPRGSSRRRQGR